MISNVPHEMKALTAVLFILGIPWLLVVVPVILLPLGALVPEYEYGTRDVIESVLLSACGLLGLAVWLGYRLRWKLGGFVWLTKRQFWILSLIHHAGWIFLIPRVFTPARGGSYREGFVGFWFASGPNAFGIWIALGILVALLALVCDRDAPQGN